MRSSAVIAGLSDSIRRLPHGGQVSQRPLGTLELPARKGRKFLQTLDVERVRIWLWPDAPHLESCGALFLLCGAAPLV